MTGSLEDLLAIAGVDVVYLASANALHPVQATQCIRAGRHVLCDKPLALTAAAAERVAHEATVADVRLGTMFQNHHHPTASRVREIVGGDRIGAVELARATIGFGPEDLVGWRARPRLAGAGAVNNLAIHAYDLVRYLIQQDAIAVTAMADPADVRALDRTTLALVRFSGGTLAFVQASQQLTHEDVRIELFGSRGTIHWSGWMAPYRSGELTVHTADAIERAPAACPDAYARLVAGFARAVAEGRQPDPSPTDAVEAVRMAEAVIRSLRTGRTVRLRRVC